MATMVRTSEDLLAIRLGVDMSSDGLRLVVDSFRGEDRLGPSASMPLAQLGYRDPQSRDSRNRNRMNFPDRDRVPDRLTEVFHDTARHADDNEAIWLQIAYGAEVLGAYPWEQVFSEKVGRALLRIPNFARNTYRRARDDHPIVICAATPRAKGAPRWEKSLKRLLNRLHTNRQIVLYVSGHQAWEILDNPVAYPKGFPNLEIRIATSPEPGDAPPRETFVSSRETISNPWLRWIVDDQKLLGSGRVHAVHFLCTGYAQDTHGAVALPETPAFDNDQNWARFVGVPEFAAFADLLDCQIVGFTALGDPLWQEGLRLFVNELSWKRPGPVLTDFGSNEAVEAYDALFYGAFSPHPNPSLIFSVHPDAVSEGDESAAVSRTVRSLGQADFSAELSYLESRSQTARDETLPSELVRVMDRLSSAKPKSVLRSARDRGALQAMDFLTDLKAKGDVQ